MIRTLWNKMEDRDMIKVWQIRHDGKIETFSTFKKAIKYLEKLEKSHYITLQTVCIDRHDKTKMEVK